MNPYGELRQAPWRKSAPLLALTALLVGAFALRLVQLGADSLWYDETVSMLLAAKSASALVAHTARDIHPPLYYLLLHGWTEVAGDTEYAAAFLSLFFGLLLIPTSYVLARRLAGRSRLVPFLTAVLVSVSPFNVWYSQEVRMYTLGAWLGVLNAYSAWQLLASHERGEALPGRGRWWLVFVASAALGLYTLYYFAFFLFFQALFLGVLVLNRRLAWRPWLLAGLAVVLLWLPWLPVAWRQATDPPVPPWRSFTPTVQVLRESFAALAFGQSAPALAWWPWLLLAVGLYVLGSARLLPLRALYVVGATWVPVAIIYLISVLGAPLYHVRYVFTYSPYYYVMLAAGLAWLWRIIPRRFGALVVTAIVVVWVALSARSLHAFWTQPAYAADDYRGAMRQLAALWRPGDALLVNAGYVYPAVNYYLEGPVAWQGRLTAYRPDREQAGSRTGFVILQGGSLDAPADLGWGLAESDFYAATTAEIVAALDRIQTVHPRLWVLRAYDTVTDPSGRVRAWLESHGTLFHDQQLAGESNARFQGWLLPPAFSPEAGQLADANFGTALRVTGTGLLDDEASGGENLDVRVALLLQDGLPDDLRLALGLVDASGRQWAVSDERPVGAALPLSSLPAGTALQLPLRVQVPPGLPPDAYELRLMAYTQAGPLPVTGDSAANKEQARLGIVESTPTWRARLAPAAAPMPVALTADFEAKLTLRGARVSRERLLPGEMLEVELLWEAGEALEPTDVLLPTLRMDNQANDDGGVVSRYPSSEWRPGQLIRDLHRLTVAPDAAPGRYPLSVQILDPQLGHQALLTGNILDRRQAIHLGEITIADRPRSYSAPQPATQVAVQFGRAIELVGYDVNGAHAQPGGELTLTLFWHALARPEGRYKIFTHLVDAEGTLRSQTDVEPGEGSLATNGWAPGEYVTTTLSIAVPADAPAGRYTLRLGLYDPVTGARVEVFGQETVAEERYLRLLEFELGS
ncbi:MAG TPA: glycosyltransferase family 39 protein [Ardenticatenaceae bacterium]|nr:glycosyltransferase family 39 protein [Ardenticatenaceae bacterium]